MTDDPGSSVTLIFYKIGIWYREPILNVIAAAAQMSHLTHVEIAIGESHEADGSMKNVARVFNDDVGVELISRTGRSPHYSYLSLGCSKAAERAMLAYARKAVGKPFSGMAMARAVLWPRQTTGDSYFCAGAPERTSAHTSLSFTFCRNSVAQSSSRPSCKRAGSWIEAPTRAARRRRASTRCTSRARRRPPIRTR